MIRKGVYPYDYMYCFEKLNDTKLPAKKEFYSKLYNEDISDKDYKHAKKVWKEFDMKTMGDYHDLYLETDVLLLTDIFENFRDNCMKNYHLDPAWYFTAPGLAYDAALKMTKVNLELLSDPDMLLLFEQGIRGGVSMITHRHGKANNPYVKGYDKAQPTKYLTYLDANNLYGWAMSQPLPVGEFEWIDGADMSNIETIKEDAEYGYMFEVDFDYPKELHDDHNDYPLAPQNVEIDKVHKLVPTLFNREKYVLHYRNL